MTKQAPLMYGDTNCRRSVQFPVNDWKTNQSDKRDISWPQHFLSGIKVVADSTILYPCSAPIGKIFSFSLCLAHTTISITTPHESTVQHIIRTHGWLHFIHLSLQLMERGTKRNQLWTPTMSTAMTLSFGSSKFIKFLRVIKMLMGKSLTIHEHY